MERILLWLAATLPVKSILLVSKRTEGRVTGGKKLCFYGTSWGAQNFPIIGAIEPRIKISNCVVGGLAMDTARPGVDQISFIHRASQPTLWFAGQYDPLIPFVESSQAAFNLLGTSKTDK